MQPIVLHGYQQRAETAVLDHIRSNRHESIVRVLVVMATGLGKTLTLASILKKALQIEEVIENGGGVLFLCHSTDILRHAEKEFRKMPIEGMAYGILNGKRNVEADFLFSTFQMMVKRKSLFDPSEFVAVIVDESHHGKAPTYEEVIDYFKPKLLLGTTATPNREDEQDIRDLFGNEVVNISLAEGLANGWLAKTRYELVMDNINEEVLRQLTKDVLEDRKRVSVEQINKTLFLKARDEEIAKKIVSYDRKGIIFCESIQHAEEFSRYLPKAETCHSKKSDAENEDILNRFRLGETRFILTVDKFNEGVDIPDTSLIVFLRSTDSMTIFLQQLGRGLRLSEGKEDVIVLDFVGNCERLETIKKLFNDVKSFLPKKCDIEEQEEVDKESEIFHIGEHLDVFLRSQEADILKVLEKLSQGRDFYPMWQQASKAAMKMGICGSVREYMSGYKEDPLLPCNPAAYYSDFPGWPVFLGKKAENWSGFYTTWQKASAAVVARGIETVREYGLRCAEDPCLPKAPDKFYVDFPGYDVFFGREKKAFYEEWQEASAAVIRLGIENNKEYDKRYKEDSRLHVTPDRYYSDFPGWRVFLGKRGVPYKTLQEAIEAVRKLNIESKGEYGKRYKEDPGLPSDPRAYYDGFPGWKKFLGKE
jgi:superfamily II DNA or RNA helicase